MPNVTTNSLYLTGNVEEIFRIFQLTNSPNEQHTKDPKEKVQYFSFACTVPPEASWDTRGIFGFGGKDYSRYWGTKWDCWGTKPPQIMKDGTVKLDFMTASGPPGKWFETTAKMFPSIHMRLTFLDIDDPPNSGFVEIEDNKLKTVFYDSDEGFNFIQKEFPDMYHEFGGDKFRDECLKENNSGSESGEEDGTTTVGGLYALYLKARNISKPPVENPPARKINYSPKTRIPVASAHKAGKAHKAVKRRKMKKQTRNDD